MVLPSQPGSDKDHSSSSSTDPEVLPEKVEPSKERLSKEMEFSSHTGSGKDHHSSSDEQDELLEETEISSHTGSDKEYQHSSTPSSSEDEMPSDGSKSSSHSVAVRQLPERDCCHSSSSEKEVLKVEQQATKGRSGQPAEQLNKRRKKQLTVKTSKKTDGGRTWDEAHYCLYCKKANLKMARHLQRKHSDETDVAHPFRFPLGFKQSKTSWNPCAIRATGSIILKSSKMEMGR